MGPRCLLLAASAAAAALAVPAGARAPFPLVPGEAVVTCKPPGGATFVMGIVDIRDPGCDPSAMLDTNWPAPNYHNELPNPTNSAADEWTQDNLGLVFGVTFDDAQPPSIYVTSTSVYGALPAATGDVYRLDGTTGAIRRFATLPNTGPGLGDIAYDRVHRQFFVTDHEDGKIYRLSFAGAILDSFDPFVADDGSPGFAPIGERLWAVQVHDGRVYFSVWVEDRSRPNPLRANELWSVGLVALTGGFDRADATLELEMPPLDPASNWSSPVSDIAFADDDWMLVAERSMIGDYTSAHQSRVLEFSGGHLGWSPSPHTFAIGKYVSSGNAAGGIDYDCPVTDPCNTGRRVWATGDALHLNNPDRIYGLQGTPDSGGTFAESYLIDLGGILKTNLGDVEVNRPVCTIAPDAGNDLAFCGAPASVTLDGSASGVIACAGAPLYRWLLGAMVVRDWSTDPRLTVSPAATSVYTLEVQCGRCPCFGADDVRVSIRSAAAPPDLANSLRGVKRGPDVVLSWAALAEAVTFNLYRSAQKNSWAGPVSSGLAAPGTTLADVPPPEFLYFYRATGVGCSGLEGP